MEEETQRKVQYPFLESSFVEPAQTSPNDKLV